MKESLVEYLICPICGKSISLKIRKKVKDEVIEGTLQCVNLHSFPVKKGIPMMLVDKEQTFVKTEHSFSAKWKKYNKTYHAKEWIEGQKRWFLERFGWKTSTNLDKFLKTRTKILDAGTGIGNSAKMLSSNPQSRVFAVDGSKSITFAYKKYGSAPNIHFLNADIRMLPFKKSFFDFICSDQVLHHTKDTESSFKMPTKLLVKDGVVSIYVYKIKGPMREFADDFIRKHIVNMTGKQCIKFS